MNNGIPFKSEQLVSEIERVSKIKSFEEGDVVFSMGDRISFIPIVVEGSLRIVRQNDEGLEVFLYHIHSGETCAMSLHCCDVDRVSMTKAVAEKNTKILKIPVEILDDWTRIPEWKSFVNNTYSERFEELVKVIDLIAFNNMDKQLHHYLLERSSAQNSQIIKVTHQEIAEELNTHREAISRLLRTMEKKNLVKLGRNSIEVIR
jgi:CRP/FNR family transcriptional regulator